MSFTKLALLSVPLSLLLTIGSFWLFIQTMVPILALAIFAGFYWFLASMIVLFVNTLHRAIFG